MHQTKFTHKKMQLLYSYILYVHFKGLFFSPISHQNDKKTAHQK